MKRHAHWLPIAFAIASLTLVGCASEARIAPVPSATGIGSPRTFAMGLSSLPADLTEESYARAFEQAASAGEVILIQRTPPWEEMVSGTVSDTTAQNTRREIELAERYGLDLFVAIDPTDASAGRSQLAGLPDELRGAGFADEGVRRAFIAYAQYVAENYRPKYLALGVEVNSYAPRHPEDFRQFVSLYHEAYQAVKQLSPDTSVFTIFQLEELQGLLPAEAPHPPQWDLISRFEPRLDVLAVSSYPSLVFPDVAQLPPSYFAQLRAYSQRPIAIAEMGYSSGPAPGDTSGTNEEQQAAFLNQALVSAQQLSMTLVVWFSGQDPTFTAGPPFDKLQHIGLKRQDGTAKPAWLVWLAAARRPLAAPDVDPSQEP